MEVTIYRKMTRKVAKYVLELSKLMEDAGEKELEVFCITNNLLEGRDGYLFIVSENKVKLGFGCFAVGINDNSFKQLQYFAIKPEYRGKGYAHKALKIVLDQEIDISGSCAVACKRHLSKFYQKLGFTLDVDNGENVGLVLSSTPLSDYQQMIHFFEVDRSLINKNIEPFEKEYGIVLKPAFFPKEETGL